MTVVACVGLDCLTTTSYRRNVDSETYEWVSRFERYDSHLISLLNEWRNGDDRLVAVVTARSWNLRHVTLTRLAGAGLRHDGAFFAKTASTDYATTPAYRLFQLYRSEVRPAFGPDATYHALVRDDSLTRGLTRNHIQSHKWSRTDTTLPWHQPQPGLWT